MPLRLDPTIPQLWRDPSSLQFGVDPARVILREVSAAQERMLWALASGVGPAALATLARSAGASEGELGRLLESVGPVLLPEAVTTQAQTTVAVVGEGMTAGRIADTVAEGGARVRLTPSPSDEPCDLGIVVSHFVLDPPCYGFWLRRDIPHLPIVFGDAAVTIGPLIEPGVGPCLYCLEHHRRDADPAWSAIASQLWGRRSAAETPLASREASVLAGRIVARRLASGEPDRATGGGRAMATSFRLSVSTGEVTRTEWMPHPECGCIAVPEARAPLPASAARRGSGSAAGQARGPRPQRPRTAAVAS